MSYNQKSVSRDNQLQNIWEELYFLCERVHHEKKLIAIFWHLPDSSKKIFILAGRLDTSPSFYEV